MRTLIDKINAFESAPVQSVEEFNKLFPYCKLEGLNGTLEVEIGELADSDTTRFLLVGSLTIKHSFESVHEEEVEEFQRVSTKGNVHTVRAHKYKVPKRRDDY